MEQRSFFAVHSGKLLFGTIIVLLILLAGGSYLRFVVLNDYLVSYEGECDPYTESCFIGCDDDECEETYYYSMMERHAAEVYAHCGEDVLECDAAFECQTDATDCSISYCDPAEEEPDTCELLTENDV